MRQQAGKSYCRVSNGSSNGSPFDSASSFRSYQSLVSAMPTALPLTSPPCLQDTVRSVLPIGQGCSLQEPQTRYCVLA